MIDNEEGIEVVVEVEVEVEVVVDSDATTTLPYFLRLISLSWQLIISSGHFTIPP